VKEIKAYIREVMVDAVVDALGHMPEVLALSVVPVHGFGRGEDGRMERVSSRKLELDVADADVDTVVDCIVRHARTGRGHPQDGKVYVSSLEDAVRIEDGVRANSVPRRSP
jgi:nitrogen regulatory protein P-II 1